MSDSNQQLIIKLKTITERLPKIVDEAGSMLARNVRSNIRKQLKSVHKYPFEFQNDFQKEGVIAYHPSEKNVVVDHPAAKRLEYGLPSDLEITPKDPDGFLHFIGQDGEDVYTQKVVVKQTEPLYYAGAAIKETEKDLSKVFKEIISG